MAVLFDAHCLTSPKASKINKLHGIEGKRQLKRMGRHSL
jgi:hypothetical protein